MLNKLTIIQLLGRFNYLKENNSNENIPFIVSNYHVISHYQLPHIKHIYKFKNTKQFENDLKFFTTYFKKVTLEEIIQNLDNKKKLNNSFLLTFDDGCVETFSVIAPILKKYEIKAAFFLNSAFVDNRDMFYRHKASLIIDQLSSKPENKKQKKEVAELLDSFGIKNDNLNSRILHIDYQNRFLLDEIADRIKCSFSDFLKKHQPYLTSNQIRQLLTDGHYIGGHSIDHPIFSDISLSEQIRHTVESTDFVTDAFNLNYKIFSIPHIDDKISINYFDEILLKEKMDIIFGNSNLRIEKKYNQVIHRVTGENPDYKIYDFINSHILYDKFERLLGKNIIIRKGNKVINK